MLPISLHIQDFCSHKESNINFDDFNCALIIGRINGNDRLSNGSGKSTIFHAIRFVIFGEADVSLDKLIRNNSDMCKVSFVFIASDNNRYRIVRSRHQKVGADVRLYQLILENEKDITARTNSQTEQEIQKIIKINYKTFCNSFFFGQSDLSGLASLRPAERKRSLKNILQLDVYSKYEAAAKKKSSDLIREIDKNRTILSTIGDPDKDLSKLNEELKEFTTIVKDKNNILVLIKEKEIEANKKYLTINKQINDIEKDIVEYSTKYKLLEVDINKLYNSAQDYNNKILSIKETNSELLNEIENIKNDIMKMRSVVVRLPQDIKQDIEILTKDMIEKKSIISSFSIKLNELKLPLPSGGKCKHCRRIITEDEFKSCQAAIDQDILEFNSKMKIAQDSILILNKKDKSLKDELQNTEKAHTTLTNKKQLLQGKEREIETKKSILIEFNNLYNSVKKEYADKKALFDEIIRNKPKDNSGELVNFKEEILQIKLKISIYKKETENINKEIQTLSNNIAILNHKIEQRKLDIEKIKEYSIHIIELERKNIIHSKVINAFGSKGIPALITQTILDDFMFETNGFLSKLRPGIQMQFILEKERSDGDLDDTLDIQFLLNNNTFEYEQLSGAQKLIVALALRLGLGSVLTKRLGTSMKMLLIDEVDQCLDDDGVELFEAAIKKLSQEMKVLVITHNKDLKSKFTNAILVEQDANLISTARVAYEW